nr:pyridoxamine 5'-phosphate oxidase family protein [Chloroflexota bacterium]
MSVLEQTPGLLAALQGEMTPKFLASRNAAGVPNVVPVVSILPAEDQPDTLFFGNFLLRKTIQNLNEDQRVGILVITQELQGWVLKGEFVEFQRTGAYVDRQMSSSLLRYNAYTGIRNAGVIRVHSVEAAFGISKWQVAKDYLLARLSRAGGVRDGGVKMPLPVQREFAKMIAVKVLTWVGEDGYPIVIPALSLQPSGETNLVCRKSTRFPEPPLGSLVAANILTFEAISYQVKGRWVGSGKTGIIRVQEVYAGGPPLPGGRVA